MGLSQFDRSQLGRSSASSYGDYREHSGYMPGEGEDCKYTSPPHEREPLPRATWRNPSRSAIDERKPLPPSRRHPDDIDTLQKIVVAVVGVGVWVSLWYAAAVCLT